MKIKKITVQVNADTVKTRIGGINSVSRYKRFARKLHKTIARNAAERPLDALIIRIKTDTNMETDSAFSAAVERFIKELCKDICFFYSVLRYVCED